MDLITSLTSQVIGKAMDGLAGRQKAISSNLANVDTPGYRRHDVQFEDALAQAIKEAKRPGYNAAEDFHRRPATNAENLPMKATSPEHFGAPQVRSVSDVRPEATVADDDLAFRADGNSVDVENEMAQLAKNTIRYNALANLANRRSRAMKVVLES